MDILINDLNGEETICTFYEKELQKTNQKEFRIEKVPKKKGDTLYLKWENYDSSFNSWNSWIDKKIQCNCIKKSQYFPKPFNSYFNDNINVKIDPSNYATKADIKNISHVDTPSFALKTNLANFKSEVHKLDIDKLKLVPTDSSKLSDAVKTDVVKKADYNKLVTKVDNIDTSGLVKKD